MAATHIHECATVPRDLALDRLDRVVARLFPQYSRSRLQQWIRSGELTVDGELRRPRDKVYGGEDIEIEACLKEISFEPEPVEFPIVYEDDAILVIDKPAGLVVHPGAGNVDGTLLNGLLHHAPMLAGLPRAGIVHRLDKDTTGLLVVARTLESQNSLVQQLQAREVKRIYEAVVYGVVRGPGSVDAPIARNPDNRTKMSVHPSGKEAVTHYRVLDTFPEHSLLSLSLETGRTHQIRVHMSHLGHPLVGDATYGGGFRMPRDKRLEACLRSFRRQALHAKRLTFTHPVTGEEVTFESERPPDMEVLIDLLANPR